MALYILSCREVPIVQFKEDSHPALKNIICARCERRKKAFTQNANGIDTAFSIAALISSSGRTYSLEERIKDFAIPAVTTTVDGTLQLFP